MQKYVLTHEKMPGEVELCFDERGYFCAMEIRGELKPETINWVIGSLPLTPAALELHVSKGFKVTALKEEITFELFWDRYKKKINLKRCQSIWNRMSAINRQRAVQGIAPYFRYLDTVKFQGKADPENYLKKEYWNNEWNS